MSWGSLSLAVTVEITVFGFYDGIVHARLRSQLGSYQYFYPMNKDKEISTL